MELNQEQFRVGFNCGYLLAAYEPIILAALLKNVQLDNSYLLGISLGWKQFDLIRYQRELDELRDLRLNKEKFNSQNRD